MNEEYLKQLAKKYDLIAVYNGECDELIEGYIVPGCDILLKYSECLSNDGPKYSLNLIGAVPVQFLFDFSESYGWWPGIMEINDGEDLRCSPRVYPEAVKMLEEITGETFETDVYEDIEQVVDENMETIEKNLPFGSLYYEYMNFYNNELLEDFIVRIMSYYKMKRMKNSITSCKRKIQTHKNH